MNQLDLFFDPNSNYTHLMIHTFFVFIFFQRFIPAPKLTDTLEQPLQPCTGKDTHR